LTSIEIAAARNAQGEPMVPEVCIFFQSALMRGNRTTKINAEGFNAFRSYNFPPLAKAGIHIKYETHLIRRPDPSKPFKAHYLLDNNVLFLTLFPGIREEIADLVSQVKGLKAVILKTYGAGNAPQRPWLVSRLKRMTEQGMIVVNITQCSKGRVEMGLYETSLQLLEAGVVNGYDATPESMLTKLMFLLGLGFTRDEIVEKMNQSLRGEITID
jgi:L-asparaginase